jgi:Cdc6-like AAA superfamily ATPase
VSRSQPKSILVLDGAPILFLRKRETGKISFLDKILAELNRPDGLVRVPGSLLRVVGSPNSQIEPLPLPGDSVYANEDADILLTKAANSAQLSILQRLSRSDGVLVQGPPGTGKTHTRLPT